MRRQLLLTALMAAAVTIPAAAQGRYGYPSDRGDRGYGRDGYSAYGRDGYSGYGRQPLRGSPVTAAQRDLETIYRRARVDHHEVNHFRRAIVELDEFNRHAARGHFDRGSLNQALDNMGDLARAHQLHPRDRQLIRARMEDLRSFRDYASRR